MAKKAVNEKTGTAYDFLSVNIKQAIEAVRCAIAADTAVMLWGSPGIGKTSICKTLGKALKFDRTVVFNPATTDVIDLRLPIVDEHPETGEKILIQALSSVLPRSGRNLIVIDEANTIPPSMQTTLNSLILDRAIGDWVAPKDTFVIATGNRESDKCSAAPMPQQTRDRFLHLNLIPDADVWLEWAAKNKIRPEVMAYVRENRACLDGFSTTDVTAGSTPRSLERLSKLMDQNPSETVLPKLISGCIGEGRGIEFLGYMDIFKTGFSMEDILKNPKTADVPDGASLAYAICSMLAAHATKDNLNAVMDYVERMQLSHQAICLGDMKRRDESLTKNKRVINWLVANRDVLL